jgi:hypothetical protein
VDTAYENALNRKKDLEAELAEIKLFLSLHARFSETKGVHREPPARPPEASVAGRRLTQPEIVANMAAAILKDARMPMTRGALTKEIENRGTKLPAKNKAKYVGTILWRKRDVFENIEGEGYWLKAVPRHKPGENDLTGKLNP